MVPGEVEKASSSCRKRRVRALPNVFCRLWVGGLSSAPSAVSRKSTLRSSKTAWMSRMACCAAHSLSEDKGWNDSMEA